MGQPDQYEPDADVQEFLDAMAWLHRVGEAALSGDEPWAHRVARATELQMRALAANPETAALYERALMRRDRAMTLAYDKMARRWASILADAHGDDGLPGLRFELVTAAICQALTALRADGMELPERTEAAWAICLTCVNTFEPEPQLA